MWNIYPPATAAIAIMITAPGPVLGNVVVVTAAVTTVGVLSGVWVEVVGVVGTSGVVTGGVTVWIGGGGVAFGTAVAITGLPQAPRIANLNCPFSITT
jgi:hypothetical protein